MTDVTSEQTEVPLEEGTPAEQQEEQTPSTVEGLLEELGKKKTLIKELRKYEKSAKEQAEKALKDQGNYRELFETEQSRSASLEQQLKGIKIDAVINSVLTESGTRSPSTVMKLLDRSKIEFKEDGSVDIDTVKAQIKELKKSDAFLFELPLTDTPPMKKPADDTPTLSYETELRKATTQKEVEAIAKKYGKA